jgi:aryl-alcohol dehydrogenase-like predicted oxidoreductase
MLAEYEHSIEVLLPELTRQQEAGKIRFLGITEAFIRDPGHQMLQRALPEDHFDVVMVGFNMINPSARRTLFPLTLRNDVGTLIMFAVRRALSREDALRELVKKLIEEGLVDAGMVDGNAPLDFLTSHSDVRSVVQAAYRFCRHEPAADVILTGTGSARHLTENVGSILAPRLPDELLSKLDQIFGRVDSVSGN